MILEQLVTAGTTTEFEVWKLRRRYTGLLNQYHRISKNSDPENPTQKPGELRIGYYHLRKSGKAEEEPVKSHLKLVIADEEITVLGSGNMDRASWYTSQELGVAFFSAEMAEKIRECVDEGLEGRIQYVC
jgi:phosphatidylserine/phosphatidylglycerophosphate/cardiolipin synthase-like enzyme